MTPQIHVAAQVTYHEIQISGLMPGTLYHFRVTSCAKHGCATATGSVDTYPSCPDEVAPLAGSWQRETTPSVGGSTEVTNQLMGVAAVSSDDVWTVGWSQDPNGPPYVRRTLIEHFDGRGWSIVPSPNREGHYYNALQAVSGTSASDVWAVGVSQDGSPSSRTLIAHWDGAQWTIVSSPDPDDVNNLLGVVAISADDVWAVGYRFGSQTEEPIATLVLHWDGTAWSEVASPNFAGVANQLHGVLAISANDIWAVGHAGGGPLALHWNGSAWSIVPVKGHDGLSSEFFNGVSGTIGNDLWE